MTTAGWPAEEVPQFQLEDRLRLTLRHRGISVGEMAEYFEVNRNTIGNWLNGHTTPKPAILRLWALRTGVPFEWLKTGVAPDGDGVGPAGLEPATYGLQVPSFAQILTFPLGRSRRVTAEPVPAAAAA